MKMNNHYMILLFAFVATSFFGGCTAEVKPEFIAVNLVGYPLNDSKQAFLVNGEASSFELVANNDGKVVFSGSTELAYSRDLATGDSVNLLDFTEFNVPGDYFIRITDSTSYESEPFKIGHDVYSKAALSSIQSFYYHRCGTAVNNGTKWQYETCHSDDAPFYGSGNQHKEVAGGWHDAGDYNKFSVNTSLSAALLLYSYESKPSAFRDGQLNIPENKNGIPDLLDEVKWGLDWLLKMQKHDGGVYHKVSQKKWIGEFLPHTDPSQRYIFGVSSASTATFAATTALASRLFKTFDPTYADQLQHVSERAWKYLILHPANVPEGGFKNPPDVRGGEYGTDEDIDERLWAAVELYRLTSDDSYLQYFIEHYEQISDGDIPPLSWRDFKSLVLNTFLKVQPDTSYEHHKERIKGDLLDHADNILAIRAENSYRNLISHNEYYWGSNSVGLAYAYHLLQAYELTQESKYKQGAYDQLHFVMGRNPLNLSQITGIGSRAVQHPYHQFSELDNIEEPVAGMLVGGPNNHLLLNDNELSSFPAYNYEDAFSNYLVNEVAINYTAIFAYVSSYLSFKPTLNTLTKN